MSPPGAQPLRGEAVDWEPVLGDNAATVDWPGAAVWRELVAENPEAVVLLSTRRDAATWLASARATVMDSSDRLEDTRHAGIHGDGPRDVRDVDPLWRDDGAAMTAYERHAASVRREVRADRLVEWQPGDGWGPLSSRSARRCRQSLSHMSTRQRNTARGSSDREPAGCFGRHHPRMIAVQGPTWSPARANCHRAGVLDRSRL